MGFSREQDPVKVERDLMELFDPADWVFLSHSWIELGREFCTARKTRCGACPLASLCPQRVEERSWGQ